MSNTSMLISIFVLTIISVGTEGLRDCTYTFKNRVASFEYSYYPGYWLGPHWSDLRGPTSNTDLYESTVDAVKTDKKLQWHLHDCGPGRVCIESRRSEYEDTYLNHGTGHPRVQSDTNLQDGPNEDKSFAIWCESCRPNPGTFTYNKCQIRTVGTSEKLYANHASVVLQCSTCGYENWFNWRIESPPTREYHKEVFNSGCNSGVTDLKLKYTLKTSITTSQTTENSVEAKTNAGIFAGGLLESLGVELGYSYTRSNMRQNAEERSSELEKTIKPNYRWVVKQLAGEGAYTTINTPSYETYEQSC